MRVNFFLIGAQKSGTSTLHDYLRHYISGVYMTPSKETFYFAKERFWKDLETGDFSFYHDNYFSAPRPPANSLYIGESSTHYSMRPSAPSVAKRIKAYNASSKILYLVRDPVERAVSNYWHFVALSAEGRKMLDAFKANPQYLKTGDYLFQIKPYLDLFPLQNIRILLFDDLTAKPVEMLKKISIWLEGSSVNLSRPFIPEKRRSKDDFSDLSISSGSILSRLKYSSLWRNKLRKFVPPSIRLIGKSFAIKPITPGQGDALTEEAFAREYLRSTLEPLWINFLADNTIKGLML